MIAPASRKIGKYEILRKLGRGGMADVYLAQDTAPAHRGPQADRARHRRRYHRRHRSRTPRRRVAGAPGRHRSARGPRLRLGRCRRLLLRRHGVHRRAGSGGADAPRPAGPRVRHRSRHRRRQDAGQRAQSANRHRRQEFPRHGPRRHQAQEHPHRCARRSARARFRHRQGALPVAPPHAQRIRQRALRLARAARFRRSQCGLGPVVAGRHALRDGHRHAALSGREHRAAGAHDPLAHRAAAGARSLPRAAAPHPHQSDGARPGPSLPVRPRVRRRPGGVPGRNSGGRDDRRPGRHASHLPPARRCGGGRDAPHRGTRRGRSRGGDAANGAPRRRARSARGRPRQPRGGNPAPSASPCASCCFCCSPASCLAGGS